MQQTQTREQWLEAAVEKFRPLFLKHKFEIPPYKISCGFAAKTPLKTLGECWNAECTSDGVRHVFISPCHKTAVDVLGTVAHETLHLCLPSDAKHGPLFKAGMELIGLEGKARHAGPGPKLLEFTEQIADELGEYPNSPLKPKEKTKRDKANSKKSFKLFCPRKRNNEKSCILTEVSKDGDYTVTTTRKMLKLGFPLCVCGCEMEMESDDWELYKLSDT
jgi:hypothetical protein